jgi:phage FluMu gp28-like protein
MVAELSPQVNPQIEDVNDTAFEARARVYGQLRWAFAKTYIEPEIEDASNDLEASKTGLLPNHEFIISSPDRLLALVKSRKIAHSWGLSLKALARAITEPRSTTIIQSVSEDEAKEKRNYLDWIWGVLPRGERKRYKMSDGQDTVKFANGSRIMFPARKPWTGANASFELDEFSIEPKGKATAAELLIAAMGAITHGGSVSVGGTQRGPNTTFNKIIQGKIQEEMASDPRFQQLPDVMWRIREFPWWTSPALCNNAADAVYEAPSMSTWDRVAKYGNKKLQDEFVFYSTTPDHGIEFFEREFECKVVDDSESYYTYDLVSSCWMGYEQWFEHVTCEGKKYGTMDNPLETAKRKVMALAQMIKMGGLDGNFGLAMDVADTNWDEILIAHTPRVDRHLMILRLAISMHNMPFAGKEEMIDFCYKNLPLDRGAIDATHGSVGRDLQSRMEKRYGKQKVFEAQFTMRNKQDWATDLRSRMELNKLFLPHDDAPRHFRKLTSQLLEIKKLTSVAGNVTFDTDRNNGVHADSAFCLMLLSSLFSQAGEWRARQSVVAEQVRNRLVQSRGQVSGVSGQADSRIIMPNGIKLPSGWQGLGNKNPNGGNPRQNPRTRKDR